jgi:serine/threonine protein kinase
MGLGGEGEGGVSHGEGEGPVALPTQLALPDRVAAAGFGIDRVLPSVSPFITDLVLARSSGATRLLRLYEPPFTDLDFEVRQKLASASQPNLQKQLDAGYDNSRAWELLSFPAGGTLAAYLRSNKGRIPKKILSQLLTQLQRVITYIHSVLGMSHKGIRPEWIFIESVEPDFVLTLSNFGIAAVRRSLGADIDGAISSPYAAPEASIGDSGIEWDWWSLGMVMLEAISGQHPYRAASGWIELQAGDRARPVSVAAVDDEPWRLLCRGLLVNDPKNRWSNTEISEWLSGRNPVVNAPIVEGATRPFDFAGTHYWTVDDLVAGLSQNWADSARMLGSPARTQSLAGWLRESGISGLETEALSDSFTSQSLDFRLARLLRDLGGGVSKQFMAYQISPDGISDLAQDALRDPRKVSGGFDVVAKARAVVAELKSSQALVLFPDSSGGLDGPSVNLRWQGLILEIQRLSEQTTPAHLKDGIDRKLDMAPAHLLLCEAQPSYRDLIEKNAVELAQKFRPVDWFRHLCQQDSQPTLEIAKDLLVCLMADYAQHEDQQGFTPPRVNKFSVIPDAAIRNTPLTVIWDVEGAQTITIEEIGEVSSAGSATVTAQTSRSFKLLATNVNGVSQRHSEFVTVLEAPKIKPIMPQTNIPQASVSLRIDAGLLELAKLPTPFVEPPRMVPFENAEGYADSIPVIDIPPIVIPALPKIGDLVPELHLLDERSED